MHTLGDMTKSLNRSAFYLHGLQTRFELPILEGSGYSDAYLAFLRAITFLRMLNVSEESLRDVWRLEKKLLQLLHVDSTGSPTWFLDACAQTADLSHRLLLTNHDMGIKLSPLMIQLGLDFGHALPEFFPGEDMGEDVMRVLGEYMKLYTRIQSDVKTEVPLMRDATRWAARVK